MPLSGYTRRALLNHVFTDPAWSPPATMHLGFSTTEPDGEGGNVTEPVGDNYSRVSTDAATWAAAIFTEATKVNASVIQFPTPSGDWGEVGWFVLYDAASGGNFIAWGELLPGPVTITAGNTPYFEAGHIGFIIGTCP